MNSTKTAVPKGSFDIQDAAHNVLALQTAKEVLAPSWDDCHRAFNLMSSRNFYSPQYCGVTRLVEACFTWRAPWPNPMLLASDQQRFDNGASMGRVIIEMATVTSNRESMHPYQRPEP